MMAKHIGWSAAFAGAAMVMAAGAAQARPVYMKLGDIKGEAAAADRDHKDWIEILSLRFAPEPPAAGGVHVMSGDVDGDGHLDPDSDDDGLSDAAARRGGATGKALMGGTTSRAPGSPTTPMAGGGRVAAPDPAPAALLLPAVQKVREAAARTRLGRCAPGQSLGPVAVRDSDSGRTGRILDATVSACAAEQVSFNFTKIEWD